MKSDDMKFDEIKFNVKIETDGQEESHAALPFSRAINAIMDGMLWGIVTIWKSDEQDDIQEDNV